MNRPARLVPAVLGVLTVERSRARQAEGAAIFIENMTALAARMKYLAVGLLFLAAARAGAEGPPYQALLHQQKLMIAMRDGVRLAADVYRPARDGVAVDGRFPVLLHRTPYGRTSRGLVEQARYFAENGYVAVIQDVRGRYESEGSFPKYLGEGRDGYDTIEHLAELPYANGKVGMWGTSYAAHVQANAAKLEPPHLGTIVVNMGGMYNGWDHKMRNHGAFELQQLTWAFSQLAADSSAGPLVEGLLQVEKARDWLTALPLRKGLSPLSAAPDLEDNILTMMASGDYDEYWKQLDINWEEHYARTADIPMMHLTGWYDSYCGGTFQNVLGLKKHLKSPIHLVVGPWVHGGNTRTHAGNVDFGPEAALSDFPRDFHLRWFDWFLKDGKSEPPPAMRLFVMGGGDGGKDENGRLRHGGYWRDETDWPLSGTRFATYYFHAEGSLRTTPPAASAPTTTYTYDPRDPVPTLGGAFSSTSPIFEPGAFDQRESADLFGSSPPYLPLKVRPDVVVFQTEPLSEPVEVVGPITVTLHVSSTAVDTDFTAKLIDVYAPSPDFPAGFEMNLTDGILRARYRESRERQVFMEPGQVYQLRVEPFPTANRFERGHRIRIDISSSNFPRFDVNPNTGEPLGSARRRVTADNTIYHDASRPSHVVLPLVPSKR